MRAGASSPSPSPAYGTSSPIIERHWNRSAPSERLLIATSAVRDAENGEAFLGEIEWSYGFKTRLLSGHDEAMLMFRGVTAERGLRDGTVIVDIGGGSTELVAGASDGLRWHDSLDIGSVRITERFLHSDPPTEAELDDAAAAVRMLLWERVPDEVRKDTRSAIGVAGTLTSIAGLALGLEEYDRDQVHGFELSAEALDEQLRRLASVPLAERRTLRPLDPDRAPVIVGGAVIAREVLDFFGLDKLEISERDILDGAALAAATTGRGGGQRRPAPTPAAGARSRFRCRRPAPLLPGHDADQAVEDAEQAAHEPVLPVEQRLDEASLRDVEQPPDSFE